MLELSLIISLVTIFIHTLTKEGMLLEFIHTWLWKLPCWLKKPLFCCPVCMTPWYGSAIIIILTLTTGLQINLFKAVLILLVAGGITSIITENGNNRTDSDTD